MNTKLNSRQIGIVILTLITAAVHLILLNITMGKMDMLFTLNGLGYLALLAAYFLPLPFVKDHHDLVRWVFIGFTALTIIAWLAMGDKSWPGGALGYLTKLDEVLLIVLLWMDRSK